MILLAALLIMGPPQKLPGPLEYQRGYLWVQSPGSVDYEWRCLAERNQPSISDYQVMTCTFDPIPNYDALGRSTKPFLKFPAANGDEREPESFHGSGVRLTANP